MLRLAGHAAGMGDAGGVGGRTGTGQHGACRIRPRCAPGTGKWYGSARLRVGGCGCSRSERWEGEQEGEAAHAGHAEPPAGSSVNN